MTGTAGKVVLGALLAAAIALLLCLGVWQLQRRVWKLDLIARVDQRAHAEPTPAPGPEAWPKIDGPHDEYRRVMVSGAYLKDRETLVQAVTEKGAGFWVMTPMRTNRDFTVLINRGFTPSDMAPASTRAAGQPRGQVSVIGLLRLSEPRGGFLRHNDPVNNRWYSRDVAAIARHDGLTRVAPYFIDADASPNPGGWPLGGLTVIRFPNSHLVYALTWFGLAAMLAGYGASVMRPRPKSER